MPKKRLPKELWEGHFGGVLPETDEQCEEYFSNAAYCIRMRTKQMTDKLEARGYFD